MRHSLEHQYRTVRKLYSWTTGFVQLGLYQTNTPVRRSWATISERPACSMERNGPTSYPLGLMAPMIAVSKSTQKLRVSANTAPASSIKSAPAINIFGMLFTATA